MKILLLGKNGQVGWELQRALAPLGEVLACGRDSGGDGGGGGALCGDLSQPEALAATVRAVRPQAIVNAAAHTAVDRAESEPELAHLVNAHAPAVLAREAAACGALLVHYGTDYVFDGSGSAPWREGDTPAPLGVYGRSKLAGERAIAASGCAHLILRTSWVHARRGGNFIKTMLRLGAQRDRLGVIDDQWGAPTGAELIADVTAHAIAQTLAQPQKGGLYHLAAGGCTTWFGYARHIFARARQAGAPLALAEGGLHAIATHQYPTPAARPHNSRLDTARLQAAFGLRLPPWQAGVDRVLDELLAAPQPGTPAA